MLYAGSYDAVLVGLSVAVAIMASYAALLVAQRAPTTASSITRHAWLAIAGLCLGIGIWAMHFVGMLSFDLPCASSYDPLLTLLSTIPGILASGIALKVISRPELSRTRLATGGVLLGGGIATMHYSGMAAMHLNGLIRYDIKLLLLSLLIAIVLATVALWIKFRPHAWQVRRGNWITITSAIVMGLAISSMHYTAMAAAYFIRDDGVFPTDAGMSPGLLAAIVLVMSSLIVVGAVVGTYVGKPNLLSFGRSKRLIGSLIVGWVMLSWLGANYYYDHFAAEIYGRETKLGSLQAGSIAANINDNIEMLQGISQMYSRDAEMQQALLHSGTPSMRDRMNGILASEASLLGADLIYVLDATGRCVMASNAGRPGSPVGTNYADRAYFPQARAGLPSHQYAVGRTTNVPGLYHVSPVFQRKRFLGAIVVKRDIAKFSRWTSQASAFVTDANGVIILASNKRLELRSLPNAAISKLGAAELLLQYKQRSIEPLLLAPWDLNRFPDAVLIGGENQPALLSSRNVPNDGLSVHVLRPLDEIVRLGAEKYWLFLLLAAAGTMLIAAASAVVNYLRELQRRDAITETFGKYVDPRIVKNLIEDCQFSQKGDKRKMTVFFCDLEGFTAMSEKFDAEELVSLLNRYFVLMSEPIRQSKGIIDKYIGDTIMAFWGPPFTDPTEHPRLACQAALRQVELLGQFEAVLPGQTRFNMRIGISTGEVIVGSIGSEVSRTYTVIGDNVNLASRLESINKYYGTNILICEEVWVMVKNDIECREIDHIRVAGKAHPIRIFEVMAEKGHLDDTARELRTRFAAGLAAYRAQRWDAAMQEFEQCVALNPNEQAAAAFMSRIDSFRTNPPGSQWDGIWVFSRK